MSKDVHAKMYERFAAEGVQVEGRLNFEALFRALGLGLSQKYGVEGEVTGTLREEYRQEGA